ncbi:MAG: High-copy suppressor of rspA [Succiniclasticum sp.]|jgi:MFS transporter, DHA2 family, lincomycin resistance protein
MEPFKRVADARLYLSIIAAGLLSFTGVVVETSMNVIFPTLMAEFGISTSLVQWVTTGYLLILSILIPTSSFLKQRFPLKRLFMAANLIFLTGTLCGGFAPNFFLLLLGRILQGAGTGIALPLMFNIVMEQAPLNRIGLMMGAAMLVTALAPAVGPSFGGYIVTAWGWHMIFLSLLPLVLFSLAAGTYAIRQSCEYGPRRFDRLGTVLIAAGFTSFLLACTKASSLAEDPLPCVGLLLLTAVFLTLFVRRERTLTAQGRVPLLRLAPLGYVPFRWSLCCLSIVMFLCLGMGFLIPNYAQICLGATPFAAGSVLLPGCFLGALMTPFAGRLYDRFGARKPLLAGSAFIFLCMALYLPVLRSPTLLAIAGTYIFFTIGQSLSMGNTMTYAIRSLPESLSGDGNAIATTVQQLSGAIGTALSAAIVATFQLGLSHGTPAFAAATETGTKTAFSILFALAILHNLFIRRALRNAA